MTKFLLRAIALPTLVVGLSFSSLSRAEDNAAFIDQIGDFNAVNVAVDGAKNSVILQQIGTGNVSKARLRGTENVVSGVADVVSGTADVGPAIQRGDHHLFDILIVGSHNRSALSQSGLAQAVEHRNSIVLRQDGINNLASQKQNGIRNSQYLAQAGNDNIADLLQDGDGNSLILEQHGDQHSATLSQVGDFVDPIKIRQTGIGARIKVTHRAGGS